MSKLKHITILVRAKLRARPGRSALVVLIPSLLFGITLAGLIVINAGFDNIQRFSDETFGGRQYVQVEYTHDMDKLATDKTIQQRAKSIYDTDIARKTSEARKLGIDFDLRTVPEPLEQVPGADKGEVRLNLTAPSAKQAIAEYNAKNPGIGIHSLEKIAKPYAPTSVISLSGISAKDGSMSLMRHEKEVISSIDNPIDTSDDFIAQQPMILMDESVMKPFINTDIHTSRDEIPVIVPYSAAETVIDVSELGSNASHEEKLKRLEYLQKNAVGKYFSVCYRNTLSLQQINQAVDNAHSAEEDSADAISYSLPAEGSCTATKIFQDKRSAETKAYDKRLHSFNQAFGIQDTSVQRKITFRIVGLVPDDLWAASSSQYDFIEMTRLLLGPSRLGNVTITNQAYDSLSDPLKSVLQTGQAQPSVNTDAYLVEFKKPSDAYKFIHEQSCDRIQGVNCATATNPFRLSAFGSGGVTLIDLKKTATLLEGYFIGVMIVVATLVMAGTFGRIIADERHEIAVFRAIGATRRGITVIYVAYALALVFLAIITTIAIGYGLAILAHTVLADNLTVALRLTYGVLNESVTTRLYATDIFDTLFIAGIVCVTGLMSVLVPLWSGINRDIVHDLKDN